MTATHHRFIMLNVWVLLSLAFGCATRFGDGVAHADPARKQHPLLAPLDQQDARALWPRKLPTITQIDWSGFPRLSPAAYGQSGKLVEVRPGRPGAIYDALNGAKVGDTILVRGGTYQEGGEGDFRALPLVREGIVLRAAAGERVRIVPRSKTVTYGLTIDAGHVYVEGFELSGFIRASVTIGSHERTLKGVILSRLIIHAPKNGEFHDGIVMQEDYSKRGMPAMDGVLIRDVQVYDAGLGISCNDGPCHSIWLENIIVENAAGAGWGADGIAVERGRNIVLVNVEVRAAAADGIDLKSSDNLVLNCNVHHVGRNGIKLWRGGDVINTLVHHVQNDAGLVFDMEGRYRFLNSVLAHNCESGRSCYAVTAGYDSKAKQQVEIINSIVAHTHGAIFLGKNTRYTIRNSILFDSKNGALLVSTVDGRDTELRHDASREQRARAGLDASVLFDDPRFVASERGDFRLRPDSPALDHGMVVEALPPRDRAGQARKRGRAPDLGAFER